jgi:hypothetical protein
MFISDALNACRPVTVKSVSYYFQSVTLTMMTFIIEENRYVPNMREAGDNKYRNKMNKFRTPSLGCL